MRRKAFGTAGLICLLLSACAAPQQQSPRTADTEPARQSDIGAETGTSPPEADENSRTAARTDGPAPENLIGMTNDDITALFGRPVFVRRDPPGEFWRYRAKNCVLELFFYRREGVWRVDHLEMRRGASPVPDKSACVAALKASPRRS